MEHSKEKKIAVSLSVLSNSALIVIKLIAGFLSGSISIISEAIHSTSDLLASFVALFSISRAAEPADKEHSYGHGKYEDFSGLVEGALIIFAALYIVYEAVKKIVSPGHEILNTNFGIAVMGISVIVNIFVSGYLFKVAKKTDSIALFADAEHLRTDVYSSLAVFFGLILINITSCHVLDPIAAILVAFVIARAGFDICKASLNNLLDGSLPEEEQKILNEILHNNMNSAVTAFGAVKTRKAGQTRNICLTLYFAPQTTIEHGHEICDKIEHDIKQRLDNAQVDIHLEPDSKKTLRHDN